MTFINDVAQNRRKSGKYILPLIILFILQQKLSSVNPIWRCNGEKRRFRRFLYFLCLKRNRVTFCRWRRKQNELPKQAVLHHCLSGFVYQITPNYNILKKQ